MWLSENRKSKNTVPEADEGFVTVTGSENAVLTDGENREVILVAPGGYIWRPQLSDGVLLLKNGKGGYLLGKTGESGELDAGEVLIKSKGGAFIHLKNDGTTVIHGDVLVEGRIREAEENGA